MGKLTKAMVKNCKPWIKSYKLFDGEGLYLQVTPKGGKWWRFKYRYLGKEKLLSLGTYPSVTLETARIQRDRLKKHLTNEVDPSAQRKSSKGEIVRYIYIVFECSSGGEGDLYDSSPCLMEVFDSRKKARAYINEKKREFKNDSHRSHYYSCPNYDVIRRKVL